MKRGRLYSLILAGALAGAAVAGLAFYLYFTRSGEMRLIDPDDIVQMKKSVNPLKPNDVMFVEVTLTGEKDANEEPTLVKVSYSAVARYHFDSQSRFKNIKDLINAYVKDGYDIGWELPKFNDTGKATGLSLESRRAQYVVIVLKCANCRFVNREIPFRIQGRKEDYHLNPRVVWKKNTSGEVMHEEEPDENVDAKIGYFIARSDRDFAANGNFRSGFNIYLELIDKAGNVPISIDPDVGYPGGNS